jgi:uncharacterized membrane protein
LSADETSRAVPESHHRWRLVYAAADRAHSFLISKVVGVARAAAAKIISLITGQPPDGVHFPIVLAVLLLLALSFLLGLIVTSQVGSRSSQWLEQTIFYRIPGYAGVKSFIHGFADTESEDMLRSALISTAADEHYFAFVMEDHGNGLLTIFVPSSPSAASGSVRIVGRE